MGIERFAVMGQSGGGPHALACGALMPERVLAAVSISGLAPIDADGLDWFAGMAAAGEAELRAAARGRAALEDQLASTEWDRSNSCPRIMPRSQAHGRGWAPSPDRRWKPARKEWSMMTWPTSLPGDSTPA
jgi:pimeloyl-ACP methyl ester carboxylesterase